jgi:hypothetical protein
MATNLGARKDGAFRAVSTAPSFNKTPVGSATPPVAYPTFADLSNSISTITTVRLNGNPIYVLQRTTQPSCKGDDAGVAQGVKSGTVNGEVKPTQASGSVRANGHYAVRLGDTCTMNGGNNPGVYVIQPAPAATRPESAGEQAPQAAPQTPAEKGFMDRMGDRVKSAAQSWKDTGSQATHEFANSAMDKGGNIAMAGGTAAAVGGGMVATGIGAAPGAVIAAGGGVTAAVGGGVTAAGGVTSSVATGLDHAADYILTGKTPDFVAAGTAYAKDMTQRLVLNKIERVTNLIPGLGRRRSGGNSNNQQQNNNRQNNNQQNNNQQGGGGNGPNDGIKARGRRDERCRLRPYKEGCPGGQTPHHVVPDHCFKQPGDNGAYYNGIAGKVEHAQGLSVCVDGATKSTAQDGSSVKRGSMPFIQHYRRLAQHGQIHARFDAIETGLGKIGSPVGTASLGQLEDVGAGVVSQVTGCNKEDLKQQLRDYHQSKGLPPETKLRADPFGHVKNLDPNIMGAPNRSSGGFGF